jgi:hypothetical protein
MATPPERCRRTSEDTASNPQRNDQHQPRASGRAFPADQNQTTLNNDLNLHLLKPASHIFKTGTTRREKR